MSAVDLNDIAVFVRVVEMASFSAAARALALPKSTVSRSVSRLEEHLGVRLLQRTTRSLRPTEAGQSFFERVQGAVAGLDEATGEVADMSKELRGTIRLTAPADVATAVLAEAITAFVQRYPRIRVELLLTGRMVDLVEERVDLAVRIARLDDSSLVARKVAESDSALFASESYLARRPAPATVEELADHECVLFRGRGKGNVWRLVGAAGERTVNVTGAIDADDIAFVHRAVVAGGGIGLIPMFLVACPGSEGLVRVLPGWALRGMPMHVVSPPTRHEPARVTAFRAFLVEELAKVQWRAVADA